MTHTEIGDLAMNIPTPPPEPKPEADSPKAMHGAEQMWADASTHLDKVLAYGRDMMPSMFANAGGNTDISVVYDWWKAYVQQAEDIGEMYARATGATRNGAHDMTILMCCAALTRLMFSTDEDMRAKNVLAQLDKEMSNDDDR